MNRMSLLLATIFIAIAVLTLGVSPAYAQCPEPGDMIPANIDIKPGSFPNPVNLKSEGIIPVALLGSPTFDVANVDLLTVGFHPMSRCDQPAAPVKYSFSDVNRDGYGDITFHFKTQDIGFQPGDTAACLHGNLATGEHFCGHDAVSIVGY